METTFPEPLTLASVQRLFVKPKKVKKIRAGGGLYLNRIGYEESILYSILSINEVGTIVD